MIGQKVCPLFSAGGDVPKETVNEPANHRVEAPVRNRAFTLVELLVVIAIIGILAALLLAALSGAKQRAWGVSCKSNLHQVQLGMSMYAEDSSGWYPISGA